MTKRVKIWLIALLSALCMLFGVAGCSIGKETLDEACDVFLKLWDMAHSNPQALHDAPRTTPVRRLDEVGAARNPVLRYQGENQ